MDLNTVVGIGASTFSGLALLPQVQKLLKEQRAEGVSMGMLAVLFVGLSLWICYGILQNDLIIIISNSFALAMNAITAALAVKYKKR
jgi:MtN3 and saliva related transmembrane protein